MSIEGDIRDPAFLIADAAMRFRNSRNWRDHIGTIMAQVGEGLGLSRVYLYQVHELDDGGLGQTCQVDWHSPGLKPLATDDRNIKERIDDDDPIWQDWSARRRRGEMVEAHARDLTGHLREDFDYQQVKSFISFPIWVNGVWWGHVGFDDCVKEREWSLAERSVLRTLGYLIGDAVELSSSSLVMSEATRLAMLNTAPDGIIVVDEAGAILDYNPAAERIFGRPRSAVIGRRVAETLIPPNRRRGFGYLMRKLQHGRGRRALGRRTQLEVRRPDGTPLPIEVTITEIKHSGRRLFVCYIRDLTLQRQTEAEVARQREALHQSEKLTALGSLLAGVAHELNNPLSVVIGRAIMLEEDTKDPAQREKLKKLREAAERCAKVAKTFLAMARQSPAVRTPTSLNKAILSALDLVSYALRSAGVQVTLDLDDALPEVIADADQMIQVFVNLFVNAEHALREVYDERRLTITTGSRGSVVFAEVRDSGPGIKPQIASRIFEPFFTTKKVGAGTGMGLAVSFGMAAAHGGNLEVLPQAPGEGACFRLTLPKSPPKPKVAEIAEAAAPALARKRVLVVDDEPEVVSLLRDILERAGHEVEHAEHGLEALSRVSNAKYDAIFCDLRMPGLDGRSLRRKLLLDHPDYQGRMIFVTGDLLGTVNGGKGIDGCPVIEKPFHSQAILSELARLVS
jgi:PAS domain S-box-containing protein